MNRNCKAAQDWISDYARGGMDIPEHALRHIESCEDCARAAAEARKVTALLTRADCVPEPPDCRSALAARISGRERPRRLAWAYPGAVLAVALGVMCFVRWSPPPAPGKRPVVVRMQPVPQPLPKLNPATQQVLKPVPKPETHPAMVRRPLHRSAGPKVASGKPNRDGGTSSKDPARVVVQAPTPPPSRIRAHERPVALVVVSWPASGEPQRNEDYSYVSRNADDGTATRCRVTRSGDSVRVEMETQTPANELPVKGSMEHESNSNA